MEFPSRCYVIKGKKDCLKIVWALDLNLEMLLCLMSSFPLMLFKMLAWLLMNAIDSKESEAKEVLIVSPFPALNIYMCSKEQMPCDIHPNGRDECVLSSTTKVQIYVVAFVLLDLSPLPRDPVCFSHTWKQSMGWRWGSLKTSSQVHPNEKFLDCCPQNIVYYLFHHLILIPMCFLFSLHRWHMSRH